ncbi:hypothetical protein C5167_004464, partial [Papaver somniferum]
MRMWLPRCPIYEKKFLLRTTLKVKHHHHTKIIVSLELHDDRCKQKAMRSVSGISGVDSVSIDIKDKKLTVIGDVDAILIVKKLRRHCHTTIVSIGSAKEPEKKKEEPKKEEPKKIEY